MGDTKNPLFGYDNDYDSDDDIWYNIAGPREVYSSRHLGRPFASGYQAMNKQKLSLIVYIVYEAILIVTAGLVVFLDAGVLRDLLVAEKTALLVVLFLSAIMVEAVPIRSAAVRCTTLLPIVLLFALMLTRRPGLAVAISGVGTFVGYGLLREFPSHVRGMPGRTIRRVLFYAAQSIVATKIISSLYSPLPDAMPTSLVLDVVIDVGLVVVYILLSTGFVSAYNRLTSFCGLGDTPLPASSLLVFFLMIVAPLIPIWLYQIVPQGGYYLVDLLGQEGVRSLIILGVWPVVLLFCYVASTYLTIGIESEEMKKEYIQFSRYSERMLAMARVTELVVQDMKAEFGCDDCIVYSWNGKGSAYEIEGGSLEGELTLRTSIDDMPDIGWPKVVSPTEAILGREVGRGKLCVFQGRDAQDFVSDIGYACSQCTSVAILPLQYMREESPDPVRVGFVILIKRGGAFTYTDRLRASNRISRRTAAHIGLRQARLYRDAQQFLVDINAQVSKSDEVLAATQSLFARGIDPAKFLDWMGRGVRGYALVEIVKGIAQSHSPAGSTQILGKNWVERLYAQIRQENLNLPEEPTDEIKKDIRTVISSLALPFVIPYRWPIPEQSEISPEMRRLYSLFLRALEANTVEDILAFRTALEDQENLEHLSGDFPEAVKELLDLLKVIEAVERSQNPEFDSETQVGHLSHALRMLDSTDGRKRSKPELVILAQVQNLWASVIYNKREEMLGWSELTMQLETQTATLTAAGVAVSLQVGNRGKSAATDIVVQMMASNEYEILDRLESGQLLDRLEPGQVHRVSFRIRPRREDFVRVTFNAVWNDRIRSGRTTSHADRIMLQPEAQVFVPIGNPYIPGPPLRPGSRLFLGREDVFDFVKDSIGTEGQHNVLVLTGQRRTGKTSLALRIPKALDQDRYVAAYVDGQALGTEPGIPLFLRDLSFAICDGLEEYGIECTPLSLEDSGRSATERFEREFLPQAFDAIGTRSLVLVFDEFETLEARVREDKIDATISGFLRHLMQHVPNLAFVFVGTHRLQKLREDYWSIFFGLALYKKIGFLDEKAARRLITEPTEQDIFDPLAVDEIVRLTAGHPYFVQLLCHYLVNFRNRSRLQTTTAQHVRDVVPDILVQAEGHLTHLWTSASLEEQMVMAATARVLAKQDSVQRSDLIEQLAAYRVDRDPQCILQAAEALVGQEIFERLDGDLPHYRFRVELIRRWIERNQPLSLVVGSLT